jgi:hypothetical protein
MTEIERLEEKKRKAKISQDKWNAKNRDKLIAKTKRYQ